MQIKEIVVLGAYGGRFDHLFANVNSLFEARTFCDAHIMLFSEDTVAFLLKPVSYLQSVRIYLCQR